MQKAMLQKKKAAFYFLSSTVLIFAAPPLELAAVVGVAVRLLLLHCGLAGSWRAVVGAAVVQKK